MRINYYTIYDYFVIPNVSDWTRVWRGVTSAN